MKISKNECLEIKKISLDFFSFLSDIFDKMNKPNFPETKYDELSDPDPFNDTQTHLKNNAENPIENSSFLNNDYPSIFVFFSINSIIHLFKLFFHRIRVGRQILLSDLPNLSKMGDIRQYSKALTIAVESFLNQNEGKITECQLLKILCRIFWLFLLGNWILWVITSVLTLMASYFMYKLIQTFEEDDDFGVKTYWGTILATDLMLVWIFIRNSQFLTYNMGTKLRLTIVQSLYEKILTLNNFSAQKANLGKIINLLSSNLNFFEIKHISVFIMLTVPVTLSLTFYILYLLIGIVSFMIVILLVLIYAGQKFIARKNVKNITTKNLLLDQRIKKLAN